MSRKHRPRGVEKKCKHCRKLFELTRKRKQDFCSTTCYYEHVKSKGAVVICAVCERKVRMPVTRAVGRKFCSAECRDSPKGRKLDGIRWAGRSNQQWSPRELKVLKDMWGKYSTKEIAAKLESRTVKAVRVKGQTLGLISSAVAAKPSATCLTAAEMDERWAGVDYSRHEVKVRSKTPVLVSAAPPVMVGAGNFDSDVSINHRIVGRAR